MMSQGVRAILVCLLLLVCEATSARAQFVTTLMDFTNSWRYNQTGLDLGTNWRSFTYAEDDTWEGPGAGLLGFDNNIPPVYPAHLTPLSLSDSIVTYYFRGGFNFVGSVQRLSLVASNYIDDGAVIYLNGTEVGRFRVAQNQTFNTRSQGNNTDGALESLVITNLSLLRQGTNVVAVELHQSTVPAVDLTWGMKLMMFQPTQLAFSAQPQNQTVVIGDNVHLTASVTGGPAFYQWQRNGVTIATNGSTILGAPSSSLSLTNVQTTASGEYRVIVTNWFGPITSHVATVTVVEDRTGPKLVSAIIDSPFLPISLPARRDTIHLQFDSVLLNATTPQSARTLANYRLVRMGQPEVEIGISNVLYAAGIGAAIWPYTTNSAWSADGNYYLEVNNVADLRTNSIAPNSRIAVQRPSQAALIPVNGLWSFHAAAAFDSLVYFENWHSTDYLEGLWWADGWGPFSGGAFADASCLGLFQTETGFQPEPTLFRTTFQWPTNWPAYGLLNVNVTGDDAVILFLNGQEIWRTNVLGSVSPTLRAASAATFCRTNISLSVSNLLPGPNVFAAALAQTTGFEGDQSFGLQLNATTFLGPNLSPESRPALTISPLNANSVRLSWTGSGFALESSTNLNAGEASYPLGPWEEVRKMSNPYTNSLATPAQFFRLKK